MRRILIYIMLAAAATGAAALDERALQDSLLESSRLWDAAVPYLRLGAERASEAYDPAAALRALAAELNAAGRYAEFKYLFDYAATQAAAGKLSYRIITNRGTSPGFWPARDGERRAVVVSSSDLVWLRSEPALERSSLLRSLATLYYADQAPTFELAYQGRNVINEFSAFMTGIWVESIYLLEVARLRGPSGPAAGYYDLILGSAQADNLSGAAYTLFGLDMNLAYELIGRMRAIHDHDQAKSAIAALRGLAEAYVEEARRVSQGQSPGQALLRRALGARTVLAIMPWAQLFLYVNLPKDDRTAQDGLENLLAELRRLSEAYRYADVEFLTDRQRGLNALALWPADAPDAIRRLVSAESEPVPFPHPAAEERWYRAMLLGEAFGYKPELPIPAEVARKGMAYRVALDAAGETVAIECYVHGKPRSQGSLRWAARVRAVRDGSRTYWLYENQLGLPTQNELGWAILAETRAAAGNGQDGLGRIAEYHFYGEDGRRVQDASGAWSVTAALEAGGIRAYGFLDYGGRPYGAVLGFAVDKRSERADGLKERRLYDERGLRALSRGGGYHYSTLTEERGPDGLMMRYAYFGLGDQAVLMQGGHAAETYVLGFNEATGAYFGLEGEPTEGRRGHASFRQGFKDGLVTSLAFFGADGEPADSPEGFSVLTVTLNEAGDATATAYFGSDGQPVASAEGFHRRESEYDDKGFLTEVRFYGTDGKPAAETAGAARIRWSLDERGRPYRTEAWDAAGALLSAPPDPLGL
jgi:hypothetical protein